MKTTVLGLALALGFNLSACVQKSGSSEAGKADGTEDSENESTEEEGDPASNGAIAISANALAAAYPEGLAVTMLPQSVDTSPGEAAPGTLQVEVALGAKALNLTDPANPPPAGEPGAGEHPRDQLKEAGERLSGEAEECFNPRVIQLLTGMAGNGDLCFGFDYGIISGKLMGTGNGAQVNNALSTAADTPAARVALQALVTQADTTQESCMVGTARNNAKAVTDRVKAALELFQGMMCQAKKSAIASGLPAQIGDSQDLLAAFSEEIAEGPNTLIFSAASIKRLKNLAENRAVYRSHVKFEIDRGDRKEPYEITMVHSPSAEGNVNYDGILTLKGQSANDQAGNRIFNRVTSLQYAKSGTTVDDSLVRYEVRNASIWEDHEPLTGEGIVDYNSGANANGDFPGNANDYLSAIQYLAFAINPSTYAGKLSYWVNPGGGYGEAARGFIFEMNQNAEGQLAGCAYAGAVREASIRKALKEDIALQPTGCYTPQMLNGICGAANDNVGPQIWRQCFKQDTQGVYLVDMPSMPDAAAEDFYEFGPATSYTIPEIEFDDLPSFAEAVAE